MLALLPWYWCNYSDNHGTTNSSQCGTTVTAGANSADSTAVTLMAALGHDVHRLGITVSGFSLSTANGSTLMDILIDPAGGTAWVSLIDDLLVGFTSIINTGQSGPTLCFEFPIFIPAGASIGARARTAHTADLATGRVAVECYGNPSRPEMWWYGRKVETLGVTAGSSIGTSVTPGVSGAFGSWTSIGSATSGRYGAVQFSLQGPGAAVTATMGNHFEIGYGSNRLPGLPNIHQSMSTLEVNFHTASGTLMPCDIPSGTQMQMRIACSIGTAQVMQGAIYGVIQ